MFAPRIVERIPKTAPPGADVTSWRYQVPRGSRVVNRIGIRGEDKNAWERRAPLTPDAVRRLSSRGVEVVVERSDRRAFPDAAYAGAGATLSDDVGGCEIVLGIKEMPTDCFRPGGAYLFFSHTIKGQPHNMAMLRSLVDRRCTLLDYELVTDSDGRRLIFFGRYAGLAGMIDTLWALGRRLRALGHGSPFEELKPTLEYADLGAAKAAVTGVGQRLAADGLPDVLRPMVVGFTGYGHVSRGAQEVFDLLPHVEIAPERLEDFVDAASAPRDRLAKVVYEEKHLVEPVDPSRPFDLQHYYDHGDEYRSRFGPHLAWLSVLVNGIFWAPQYPRLADAEELRALFSGARTPRLLVVGDITCDVDGSLACTVRDTEPGDPVYVYDPLTRRATSGFACPGLAVMAVSNLPCELPREASETFSEALLPFIPELARARLTADLQTAGLPDPLRRAVILWRGHFAPELRHMSEFLT
jgi:alanine dehydrogenase